MEHNENSLNNKTGNEDIDGRLRKVLKCEIMIN